MPAAAHIRFAHQIAASGTQALSGWVWASGEAVFLLDLRNSQSRRLGVRFTGDLVSEANMSLGSVPLASGVKSAKNQHAHTTADRVVWAAR